MAVKKTAAKPRANGTAPNGWRKVERKARVWWSPDQDDDADGKRLTDQVLEGTLVAFREARSKFSDKPQPIIVVRREDGTSVNVRMRGNIPYLIEDGNVGEGETIRLEYLGFTAPSSGLPMGRHEFDLMVRA